MKAGTQYLATCDAAFAKVQCKHVDLSGFMDFQDCCRREMMNASVTMGIYRPLPQGKVGLAFSLATSPIGLVLLGFALA